MKPKTIFIPHEITNEGSLPKEEGWYLTKHGEKYYNPNPDLSNDFFLKRGLFWLEEKEIPTDEEIFKQSKKFVRPTHFKDAIIWFKSKLGI